MGFAIRATGQRLLGRSSNAGPVKSIAGQPQQLAQTRSCQEFIRNHRRHRVTGKPKHRGAIERAKGHWLRWFDSDLHPPHVSDAAEYKLHVVEVAHADATTGDDGVTLFGAAA